MTTGRIICFPLGEVPKIISGSEMAQDLLVSVATCVDQSSFQIDLNFLTSFEICVYHCIDDDFDAGSSLKWFRSGLTPRESLSVTAAAATASSSSSFVNTGGNDAAVTARIAKHSMEDERTLYL